MIVLWLAAILSLCEGASLDLTTNEVNATTSLSEDEKTTILFSNFYSASTVPQTTTDLPEEELSFYDLERQRMIEEHPCRRDCSSGEAMDCVYKLEVTLYHSLSKACFDCPYNLTDCYREDCVTADGVERPLIVANKRLPGPAIEVCLGDRVEIELVNHLVSDTTSVHWHGLHQRESPYMDGVPYISQCPVLPKSTFVYRYFAANTGTHFWHSHSGSQRGDGLFGALIVRSANDSQAALYDEDLSEHMILATDWSHSLITAVFSGHHHARVDNKPPTLMVNGRGLYGSPPASFTVQQGVRYRFRFINSGILNCPIELSIDDHNMTIINSDGFDIKPITVDSLVTYAGERWDFVLEASRPVANYWMRFKGLMDCDERFTSAYTAAILHYAGADHLFPPGEVGYSIGFFDGKKLNPLNEKADHPSISVHKLQTMVPKDKTLEEKVDRTVVLSYDFNPIDNLHFYKPGKYGFYQVAHPRERVLTPQINHVSLMLPPFPLLSQYSDLEPGMLCSEQNLTGCSEKYCECLNVIDLKLGEVVELFLIDKGVAYDANHPFHLHGHAFRVVAMDRLGNSTTVDEVMALDAKGAIKRNLVDAPMKDTVTVPDGGYTIVRFVADNPGFWMLHCHLDFHIELGMAVIFKVGSFSDFPPVPKNFPRCGNYISPPLTSDKPSQNEKELQWKYNSTETESIFTVSSWWLSGESSGSENIIASGFLISFSILLLFFHY